MAETEESREFSPPKSGCGWAVVFIGIVVVIIGLLAILDPEGFSSFIRWLDSDWSEVQFKLPDNF